jgi:glutaminyl-tRNA synthetase
VIRCDEIIRDEHGEIIELHCSYDPATLGANPEGRKVKGVIHWVSAVYGIEAEIRLYDRLFNTPAPDAAKEGKDYKEYLNPDSLRTLTHCIVEPSLKESQPGERFQFEREGYFCVDLQQADCGGLVFNRTVTLRDSWAKLEQQQND